MIKFHEATFATAIDMAAKALPSKSDRVDVVVKKSCIILVLTQNAFKAQAVFPLAETADKADRVSFALDYDVASSIFSKTGDSNISLTKKGNVISFVKKAGSVIKSGKMESIPLVDNEMTKDETSTVLPTELFTNVSRLHKLIKITPLFNHAEPAVVMQYEEGKSARVLTADNHHMVGVTFKLSSDAKNLKTFTFVLPQSYMRYFEAFNTINSASTTKNGMLVIYCKHKNIEFEITAPSISQDVSMAQSFDEMEKATEKAIQFPFSYKLLNEIQKDILKRGCEDVTFFVDKDELIIKGVGKGFEVSNKISGIKVHTPKGKSLSFVLHAKVLEDLIKVFDALNANLDEKEELHITSHVEKALVVFKVATKGHRYTMIASRAA